MKRRLVAFMLIMAVCANLYTTVFAARDSAWSEEETDNMWETPDYMQSNGSASSGENSGTKEEEKPKEPIDGIIEINGGTITVMPDEEVKKEPPLVVEQPDNGGSIVIEDNRPINAGQVTTAPDETETLGDTAGSETSSGSVTVNVDESKKTPVESDSTIDKDGNAEFWTSSTSMSIGTDGTVTMTYEVRDRNNNIISKRTEVVHDKKIIRNAKIQQELKDYAKSIGFTDNRRYGKDAVLPNHEYAEEPVIGKDSCVAGKLADSTLKEGLDLINMIRKTAGLGEVTLDDAYNEYAQNGALIMKASEGTIINGIDYGGLSHNPIRADNITDEQNALGIKGTRNGNIGLGHTSLTESILNGYMYDGDPSNIAAMGHRRWILNPTMGKVGFGQVDGYNCMYAHDNTNSSEKIENFVTWPAENMPIELMPYRTNSTNKSTPWTCQLGTNYKIAPSSELTITVTYPDGHEYKVPQSAIYCNNQKYGYTNGCITFRADDFNNGKGFEALGSNYSVKIDGVLDKDGNKTSIEYDVNFFNLF